ncbi:MAG: DUF3256 family protein [Prevotella sp.]|nr:DUF3256 family protein [Prevotella sp.]
MTKFLFSIIASMAVLSATAQKDMRQLWVDMPDSIVQYLNNTKRTEMVDFYDMGVKAETTNRLASPTVLDTLTTHYAHILLNEAARMQLALLDTDKGDSVICMVRTFLGEAPESVISFYNTNWQPLDANDYLESIDTLLLLQRPDTMDMDTYNKLVALIDPIMIEACYIPGEKAIEFQLSTPFVTKEERRRLECIRMQRKVKWNGKRFI